MAGERQQTGKYGGPHTPKSGPYSGVTFSSYRQYLNAKELTRQRGVITTPERVREEARGLFSRAVVQRQRERRTERVQRTLQETGVTLDNEGLELLRRTTLMQYARQRARQRGTKLDDEIRKAGRPGSEFMRLWNQSVESGFEMGAGKPYHKLLEIAGRRTESIESGNYAAVVMTWQLGGSKDAIRDARTTGHVDTKRDELFR